MAKSDNFRACDTIREFGEGENYHIRIHSGYLPVYLEGYPLPSWRDIETLANDDVFGMPPVAAYYERNALTLACAAREELREIGVTLVLLIAKPNDRMVPVVQDFEDWALRRLAMLDNLAGPIIDGIGGDVASEQSG